MLLMPMLAVSLDESVDAKRSKRDIVNLMEKVEDKCGGNEECLRATYKKLEESIGVYSGKCIMSMINYFHYHHSKFLLL